MVTAYDTPRRASSTLPVDAVLVRLAPHDGAGYDSTLPVTMDRMVSATARSLARNAVPRRRRHAVHELPGQR